MFRQRKRAERFPLNKLNVPPLAFLPYVEILISRKKSVMNNTVIIFFFLLNSLLFGQFYSILLENIKSLNA